MKKIPLRYREEFLQGQIALTKSRLRLFAGFFMLVFVSGNFGFYFFMSADMPVYVIQNSGITLAVCMTLILLSRKAPNMTVIKLSAFVLLGFLFFMIAGSQIYFSMNVNVVLVAYLLMFFSISLIIPWGPAEIILVALLVMSAFTLYFWNVVTDRFLFAEFLKWFQGAVVLFLTYLVCFFVKRHETGEAIEGFLLLKGTEDKNRQMSEELDLATSVHAKLVPKSRTMSMADIAVSYLPVSRLGGDYGNFRLIDDRDLIFLICDVSGHGVPAALFVSVMHTETENIFNKKREPGAMLRELDKRVFLPGIKKTGMLATAFCGFLDYGRMKFVYSSYGHPPQYIYRPADRRLEPLEAQTTMMGIVMGDKIYQSEIPFSRGDQIILFTDGVIEARDREGKCFGEKRLISFIRENNGLYVNVFNERLLHELVSFTDNNFYDDIFIFNIRTK